MCSFSLKQVPRYQGLRKFKDFDSVNSLADGNCYLDLMKQILPCLLAVFRSADDVMILTFRMLVEIRTISSFTSFDDDRLDALSKAITRYSPLAQVLFYRHDCVIILTDS
jgi:hypothetical protein